MEVMVESAGMATVGARLRRTRTEGAASERLEERSLICGRSRVGEL